MCTAVRGLWRCWWCWWSCPPRPGSPAPCWQWSPQSKSQGRGNITLCRSSLRISSWTRSRCWVHPPSFHFLTDRVQELDPTAATTLERSPASQDMAWACPYVLLNVNCGEFYRFGVYVPLNLSGCGVSRFHKFGSLHIEDFSHTLLTQLVDGNSFSIFHDIALWYH